MKPFFIFQYKEREVNLSPKELRALRRKMTYEEVKLKMARKTFFKNIPIFFPQMIEGDDGLFGLVMSLVACKNIFFN